MITLDPTSPETMTLSAAHLAAGARDADMRRGKRGTRDELIAWLRSYDGDEQALDALSEPEREEAYTAAWAVYAS